MGQIKKSVHHKIYAVAHIEKLRFSIIKSRDSGRMEIIIMLRKFLYTAAAVTLVILGKYLLKEDFGPFLQWWAVILVLGLIFLPLTGLLFQSFEDKGYLFSKTIGIAVTGYLMWLFSSLHLLKFTVTSCFIVVGAALIMNLAIALIPKWKSKNNNTFQHPKKGFRLPYSESTLDLILLEELLFVGIFLIFTYIRGFKPEAYGTEKFMDYGFMTTMARSDYMPPQDFWYAGTNLNYYYVGQFLATFLSKVTFVGTALGYNLMLMMTGAFTAVLPFSIAYQLSLHYLKDRRKKRGLLPSVSGLLASAGVCIAGNMHYPIYKWLIPAFQKLFRTGQEIKRYWFPDATRFIGYNPDTHDKTIHEFPAYSFVLGDLHAHVINLLFVLTVLGILLAWLLGHKDRVADLTTVKKDGRAALLKEVFQPPILMLGFFIGLFHTTNFWDYPIYYVVSGAIILFSNLVVYNFKGKAYLMTAYQGILVLVLGEIICLPFTLNFNQISATPYLTVAHTPFYQLMVLWGLPILTVLVFLSFTVSDYLKSRVKHKNSKNSKKKKDRASLAQYMQGLNSADLFILTIGLCAIGLILLPELVYIKDIYSGDYKRANTMFKLTYQAFVMFGICFGYIFIRLLVFGRILRQKVTAGVGLFLFTLTLFYVQNATKSWYGNIFDTSGYLGIDSTAFMEQEFPEDAMAADWLNENITGTPVVLEANGDSYTEHERISVITGLPTALGWYTHERLWKSESGEDDAQVTDMLDKRAEDIKTIYTSADEETVRSLIQKYNISYIYVGGLEEKKYQTVNHELLKSLGAVVYESLTGNTYIVMVK